MGFFEKIKANPYYFFIPFARRGWFDWLPDAAYLKMQFRGRLGEKLDLNHPVTFNQKLQWLKLNDRDPEHVKMVDKYEAKEYVAGILGPEYIIPTLGVWDRFDDIDFDALPDRFVLKCTHDSHGLVICHDKSKLDMSDTRNRIAKSLNTDYYKKFREWPYRDVKHRIIAEQYMEDSVGKGDLTDYKLHFFSGECKVIMVGKNRFGADGVEKDFYSIEWEHLDIRRSESSNAYARTERPPELDKMVVLGKKIAKDMPFVRVDFYIVDHQIYFGEITFFPTSGLQRFNPDNWDTIFGRWIKLPIDQV